MDDSKMSPRQIYVFKSIDEAASWSAVGSSLPSSTSRLPFDLDDLECGRD
jgi:hypothetical protein